MRQRNKAHALALLIGLAVLSVPQVTLAQEDAAESAASESAEAAIERINTEVAELNRLRALMPDMEQGFRALQQRRLDDQEAYVTEGVNKVAEQLLRAEDTEPMSDVQRSQIAGWLRLLNDWLIDRLARNSRILAGQIGSLSGLSINDAAFTAIEVNQRSETAVDGLASYNRSLNNLGALDVDVTDSRQALIDRVREGAELIAVAIEIDTEELRKLRYRLSLTPDDADLQTMIKIVDLRRDGYARSLRTLSNLLQDLGIDPSQYRSMVLLVTGDVASQILDTGVMAALAKQWSKMAWTWINENGLALTIKVLAFFGILLAFRALSRLTRRWAESGVQHLHLSVLLRSMLVSTAANVVMVLGIMIALTQLGISLGPLLAGLGVLGFIIGFALQDTLGNFASGMMILMYRPYDVGDVITAGGVTGKVRDMSLVYTVINTFDNQKMVVPNSKIWGDVIQNVTSQRVRRVDLVFGISYSDDIAKAERILAEIIDEHELTLKDPEPTIKVHTLNESSVDFIARPWAKSADYWPVYWDITREVKLRFDKEGITIPFPQRDVHNFYKDAPPSKA